MELKRLRCTSCGADFENVQLDGNTKFFHCTRKGCGAIFMVDQGQAFAEKDGKEAGKIQEFRTSLKKSMEPFQDDQVRFLCEEILSLLPNDYRANALLAICNSRAGKRTALPSFLSAGYQCTEEEFREVFPCLLRFGDYNIMNILRSETIPRCVGNREDQSDLLAQVDEQKSRIRRETDLYALVHRDVFVCHSSAHPEIAMRAVQTLEKDGNTCWISSRNLRPEAYNYWDEIEEALSRCRIFLVITTENAMMSPDVQKEITMAVKHGLRRVELKCDNARHTSLFKDFFDGLSWIDATRDEAAAMAQLRQRVCDLRQEIAAEDAKKTNISPGEQETKTPRDESETQTQVPPQGNQSGQKIGPGEGETGPDEDDHVRQAKEVLRKKLASDKRKRIFLSLLAILLYTSQFLDSGSVPPMTSLFYQKMGVILLLYFLAAMFNIRILMKKTLRSHGFIAFLQVVPLIISIIPLKGFFGLPPVSFADDLDMLGKIRAIGVIMIWVLILALFGGISARRNRTDRDV